MGKRFSASIDALTKNDMKPSLTRMRLLEAVLVARAQLLHRRKIHFVEGGEQRLRRLRLDHARGDALPQPRHGDALLGARPAGRCALGGGWLRWRHARYRACAAALRAQERPLPQWRSVSYRETPRRPISSRAHHALSPRSPRDQGGSPRRGAAPKDSADCRLTWRRRLMARAPRRVPGAALVVPRGAAPAAASSSVASS